MYINMCACVCVWRGWRNSASLSAEVRVPDRILGMERGIAESVWSSITNGGRT